MITYNGKEFRNLVEQVLKNKNDIEAINDINRSLADYGIKIIGFYDTIEQAKEDLGDPYEGPYGNAVGIGLAAPYDFYIWTRANNLSEVDYWQDVGTLAVMGPQGPQGETGEQGEPGQPAKIFTGANLPTISGTENDIYLCVSGDPNLIGNIYKIESGEWKLKGNIRGPQGVQGNTGLKGDKGDKGDTGERGPQGDPGGFIKIAGILEDGGQLPNPTILKDLEVAYLVGPNKEVWMQVGPTYEQAIWTNIGALNLATYVTVDGEFQNTWNADTKLDKLTTPAIDGGYRTYAVDDLGDQTTINLTGSVEAHTGVMRGGYGEIYVPEYPEFPNEATSKQYVDELIVDSETIKTYWEGPGLSLNLSSELVADIGRSVKTPTTTPSTTSLPIYNSDTGVINWTNTNSYVASANGPKHTAKPGIWAPTAPSGQIYEIYGYDTNTPTFNITVTKLDNSQAVFTDLHYAKIVAINSGWIHIIAFQQTSLKVHMYVKGIINITKSHVFGIKYNLTTVN